MPRPKITIVGRLRFSSEGLLYSTSPSTSFLGRTELHWSEVLNVDEVPGLRQRPVHPSLNADKRAKENTDKAAREKWRWLALRKRAVPPPVNADKAAEEKWSREVDAWNHALHTDPAYTRAASEFMKRQHSEPQLIPTMFPVSTSWTVRDD
jgi:hypothetical protein